MPIETDEEWDLIEEMLNTFLAEEEEEDMKKALGHFYMIIMQDIYL